MLGYIEYDPTGGKTRMGQEKRFGGTFMVLYIGKGGRGFLSTYRAAAAAKRMQRAGVRRAVFPTDFPHTLLFLRHGIAPIDPLPLRRALAAKFVTQELARRNIPAGEAVVAVVADHALGAPAETVRELAFTYRYVLLSVRSGGEELAKSLRRQYGVALLLEPSEDQIRRADALILFDPPVGPEPENAVLCTLFRGETGRGCVPLRLDESIRKQIEANCSHDQLAAALYSMGILAPEQLLGETPFYLLD